MFPTKSILLAFLLLATGGVARAQVTLPQVQVPNLPGLPTEPLNRTVNDVLDQADPQRLRELRQVRIRHLLRTNRTVLEADPRGAPIVRSEVVALSPTPAALDRARAAGFGIGRTRTLEGLDVSIVVLQAPQGMSTRRALERLRREDPEGTYDYNHVYLESGVVPAAAAEETSVVASNGSPAVTARVGLIDGGVQRSHPVFNGVNVHEHGCTGGAVPSAHGTAVASLLVGQGDVFHGAAPGAELFAADVYCGLATGGALDSVAEAFAWMSREKVPVINISLVGPANVLLERIVRVVTARGHIVVAAVGNDGPSAPPLFPAAYPEVVAVTGVDAKQRVLVEACRGKHVDFSAPGANMSAAGIEAPFGVVRGTSFAAPLVAGLLARQLLAVGGKEQAEAAIADLAARATDLGARGVDKIYGNGLVGNDLRPPEQLSSAAH
ncbi:S8 family serine peptidase [Steroidobacter agaridevorans]|uniref:S8 family serine peptidase n=1 Tax=Steroidobacter agaridevorans TaxID=2695856 RepID=UPI001323EAE5|nr:S8 family serine peptidase [Steroidobacter agaridevorans]GFE91165.1 protease [Steroidobacter agaridevorans]